LKAHLRRSDRVVPASVTVVLLLIVGSVVIWRNVVNDADGPSPHGRIRSLAVIGDSYSQGTPLGGLGDKGWPALVADHYGATLTSTAITGRGYLDRGRNHPGRTFPEQAREIVSSWDGDVLIVFGSRNDSRRFAPSVQEVAKQTLTYLKHNLPHTHIIVIGPTWPSQFPPGGDPEANREAVRAAAQSVPDVVYVDPMEEPWFSERNGVLVARDQGHFTDAGHRYLSEKIIAVLDRTVLDS
jgi:lysophospholipase L1-like esterase